MNVMWDVKRSKMGPKRIGFIGFDGVGTMEMTTAAAAFDCAEIQEGDRGPQQCYEVVIIGLSNKPFAATSGIVFKPHKTFKNAPPLDTLVIPGGKRLTLLKPQIGKPIAAFVKARAGCTRRIVSFCSGIYGLAMTGLLAGRRVATHWRYAQDVARRFPELRVDDNAIFLKDGPFYTSAGATAGIDLALALIEEDYGPRVALAVARELIVYLKRLGGQEQYSEPLQFQAQSISRLSELTTWMLSHLYEDLSVENLAAKACVCPRHFSRRFKVEFGTTPADFVERLRLGEARHRLSNGDNSVGNVGISVGFRSASAFCRAFERRLGLNPSEYRRRFATSSTPPAPTDRQQGSKGLRKLPDRPRQQRCGE
jgi:transcriptional regulator GlxA family with amidase domain